MRGGVSLLSLAALLRPLRDGKHPTIPYVNHLTRCDGQSCEEHGGGDGCVYHLTRI